MSTEISLEALKQEMRSGAMVLVGCRAAGSPSPPAGTKRGIRCIGCQAELEASPTGRQRISAGAKPVCIPCATAWAELAADKGRLGGVEFGPHAEQSLATGRAGPNADRLDLLRMAHPYRGPK
jgi:hypothetical protein